VAQRPPLGRWLLYAFGFRLPDRYDEWVFHDLNSRGWAIREVARVMLVAALPIIGIMFLPAGIGLRLMTASFLVFGPAFLGAAYADELRAYRLRQHGLLPPSGPDPEFPRRPS
jgi:Family of unknown function (DUF5313)